VSDGVAPQQFPPPPQPFRPDPDPGKRPSGGRIVAAAMLVGALAGGAAGFGGAAALEHNQQNTAATSASSSSGLGDSAVTAPPSTTTSERVAKRVSQSVVQIFASSATESGSGSGIVLDTDGNILTNNHVVAVAANSRKLVASFPDGESAKATIVGRDPLTDLAVIRVRDVKRLDPATLGTSADLQVGQPVMAVGSPFGLDQTVTSGIVSALNRPVTTQSEDSTSSTVFPAIQTDAAINPGNSGGPLVDMSGRVIGVNSAIQTATSDASSGGQGGSIGLGFAIPVDEAKNIAEQLLKGQTPAHARLGVEVTTAQDENGVADGARVARIDGGSAAAKAGLRVGDVITSLNGQAVHEADSLVALVRLHQPGEAVKLGVTREASQHTISLILGADS
jgi:putative serine protease PepD